MHSLQNIEHSDEKKTKGPKSIPPKDLVEDRVQEELHLSAGLIVCVH